MSLECSPINTPLLATTEDPCKGNRIKTSCVYTAIALPSIGAPINTTLESVVNSILGVVANPNYAEKTIVRTAPSLSHVINIASEFPNLLITGKALGVFMRVLISGPTGGTMVLAVNLTRQANGIWSSYIDDSLTQTQNLFNNVVTSDSLTITINVTQAATLVTNFTILTV